MEELVMIKDMNSQPDEIARREKALAALGGEVEGDARVVAGREIMQMLSVRVEPDLIVSLREIADLRGVKVSDLMREAAARLVSEFRIPNVSVKTWPSSSTFTMKPLVALRGGVGTSIFGEALGSSSSYRSA